METSTTTPDTKGLKPSVTFQVPAADGGEQLEKGIADLQLSGRENSHSSNEPKTATGKAKDGADGDDDSEGEDGVEEASAATPDGDSHAIGVEQAPKKKKKNRKSKSKRAVTGFEENYAEAPLTPDEFQENLKIYDRDKPFSQRIETCIQRYKARRKFDPYRNMIFENYLVLGGITAGQNKFSGGLDIKHNDDRDAEEIARFTATDYVDQKFDEVGHILAGEEDEDEEYIVDFNYIVRGFLSYKVPFVLFISAIPELDMCVKLIRNFLNYILYHKVCDEFKDNITEALETCKLAEKELPVCQRVSSNLPGSFNKACSTLFGGHYELIHPYSWDDGEQVSKTTKKKIDSAGFSQEDAEKIFLQSVKQTGIATAIEAGLKTNKAYKESVSLKIVSVSPPPEGSKLDDLGKIQGKVWTPEGATHFESRWGEGSLVEIWLEKSIVQYMYEGMCVEATVHEMDSGLCYIDSVTGVMTSFYLELREDKSASLDSSEFD